MERIEEREPLVLTNNGQKIFGVIHRPVNVAKPPVVLMCHGLGGQKVGKGRIYVQLAEKLSAMGIASLRIDFRGSGDSEGDFSAMTVESEVSDALVALDYLKKDSSFDSTRIALFGRSFGGAVAVLAAHRFGAIKSLALWAPVFGSEQWKEMWLKLHSAPIEVRKRNSLFEIEGLSPGYPFFEQLFSLKLQEPLKDLAAVPLLHIHGEKDNVVDLSHADKYREARQHALAKSTFMLLQETDHEFSHQEERHAALEATREWIASTLKD